ncbi:MAG: hypothetical protein JXP34_26485 [Planctomycetes bacterium]|nr:hypothetical protein [Planctomycetota bacterium]
MMWWLAQNAAGALILAGIAAALGRLARLGPASRHALWVIVLAKLVMPPVIHWPWPISMGVEPAGGSEVVGVEEVPIEYEPAPIDFVEEPAAVAFDADPPPAPAAPPVEARIRAPRIDAVLAAIFVAGGIAVLLIQISRTVRLRFLVRRARPAPPDLVRQVSDLAKAFGVRPPETRILEGLGSPILACIGRATILLPASWMASLGPQALRTAIAHELAHIARRDHWTGWIELAAGCVSWWNPIYWIARREVRENAELACDARVVEAFPGERRAYAEILLAASSSAWEARTPASVLGLGAGARRKFERNRFERRLTMVMRGDIAHKASIAGAVALAILSIAAVPAWSQGGAVAPPASDPAPTPSVNVSPPAPSSPAPPQPAGEAAPRQVVLVPTSTPSVPPAADEPAPIALPATAVAAAATPPAPPPMGKEGAAVPGAPVANPFGPAPAPGVHVPDPAGEAARIERLEKRFDELERRIQILLREIVEARSDAPRTLEGHEEAAHERAIPSTGLGGASRPVSTARTRTTRTAPRVAPPRRTAGVPTAEADAGVAGPAVPAVAVVYSLSPDAAASMADFLQKHVIDRRKTADVKDVAVNGAILIVTATPAGHARIAQFLSLLPGRPPVPAVPGATPTPAGTTAPSTGGFGGGMNRR